MSRPKARLAVAMTLRAITTSRPSMAVGQDAAEHTATPLSASSSGPAAQENLSNASFLPLFQRLFWAPKRELTIRRLIDNLRESRQNLGKSS